MERKKRSKGRGWESCYVKKIYGTFGVEMRAYGQKLVKFCTHTHTRLSYSSIEEWPLWRMWHVSTLQKSFVLRLVDRTPMVIWESWTAYNMWVIMISALITFSIQKLRLLLSRWAPSRKMVLCSSQWWCRGNLSGTIYWSAPLDNRVICSCSAGLHISLMEVMVVCH